MVTEINPGSPAANPVAGNGLRGMSRRADGTQVEKCTFFFPFDFDLLQITKSYL